ncbi:hypothetical protein LCM17_23000 [Cereibacter sphaeroides]|nr:hypothetical protein [Cereibacter sphaeroides]
MGLKRDIHPDLMAVLEAGAFHPVSLVFVDWPGDPVRVHTGSGTITWAGEDWIGLHEINAGSITLPEEAASLGMVEGQVTIGGDPERFDDVLEDAPDARGVTAQVWFGAVTERNGTVLIGEPFSAFTGTLGAISDTESPDGEFDLARIVTAQLVSGPSQRSKAGAAHSWHDQRRVDPEDTAGRWVSAAISTFVENIPSW